MKFGIIFADNLYAFSYQDDDGIYHENEYNRLIELWTNVEYLKDFYNQNKEDIIDFENSRLKNKEKKEITANEYVNQRIDDADEIIDIIEEISNNKNLTFESFFQPLDDNEYQVKDLSLQKGKSGKRKGNNYLRIYAIKLDSNCFVITGGAIKASKEMDKKPDTLIELSKIKRCRQYLKDNSVVDADSFKDFLKEVK